MTQLDVPGNQTSTTLPIAVNTSEAVVGFSTASSGSSVGFLYSGGKYTVDQLGGIGQLHPRPRHQRLRRGRGRFPDSDGVTYHGFTYVKGTYKQYDVGGNVSTSIFGVNTAGDFAGAEGNAVRVSWKGFTYIGGKLTEFYANGTDSTYAYAINSSDEVVGEYFDSSNLAHGFYRSASGTITEIAYPGAIETQCHGINDAGEITGTYIRQLD